MTDKDRQRFAGVMAAIAELFEPGKTITPLRAEIYFKALAKFDIKDIERAANLLITTRKFNGLPKPADFIELIKGSEDDILALKWHLLYETIARVGPYSDVAFEDPVISSSVEMMGGWTKVCDIEDKQAHFAKKQFIENYRIISKNPHYPHPEILEGIITKANKIKGLATTELVAVAKFSDKGNAMFVWVHPREVSKYANRLQPQVAGLISGPDSANKEGERESVTFAV